MNLLSSFQKTNIGKKFKSWQENHPKLNQYYWFIILWLSGLVSVAVATYPLKLIVKLFQSK
ncbi:MAG: hypothetical protein ACK4OM_01560 [Alphaproteobacteria bacterium]